MNKNLSCPSWRFSDMMQDTESKQVKQSCKWETISESLCPSFLLLSCCYLMLKFESTPNNTRPVLRQIASK